MNDATGSSADVSLPAHAALNALFTGTGTASGAVPAPFLQESFWQSLLDSEYRFIQLDDPAAADHLPSWLAPEFLAAARLGQRGIAGATLPSTPVDPTQASLRTSATAKAIGDGFATLLSPFTGTTAPVTTSLGLEWSLHTDGARYCLASQMGPSMIAVFLETVWVFPQERLVLFVASGLGPPTVKQNIARSLALWLSRAEQLAAYIAATPGPRKIAVTDFWCPHLAHNLWNIQTGWANLFDRCDTDKIGQFLLFTNQNFFGDLAELYPDRITDRLRLRDIASEADILDTMIAENLLLFTVKDEIFHKTFTDRVLRRARNACTPQFLQDLAQLQATAKPLVVTTVRLDNRAWLEQRDGIPALFNHLQKQFPHIGLVIDGLSSDSAKGWTTGWMSMQADLEMAAAMRAQLSPTMPVMLSVGRLFAESLVLCDAADLFIAPAGSGMTLYKWISNLPGLAFSNTSVLDDSSPHRWPLRVWHDPTFRADITPTTHLPAHQVQDEPSERDHVSRHNFHMDWHDLIPPCVALIEALDQEHGKLPA